MKRIVPLFTAMLCIAALYFAFVASVDVSVPHDLPGLTAKERVLLRVWVLDAPGGGQAWLRGQVNAFEKQHRGVTVYLRQATADELSALDAILPDMVLYQPGSLTDPAAVFLPLSGEGVTADSALLRESLLRCGRHRGTQYGLPLCWSAWVLALDGALDPEPLDTPAPTTLLGRASATAEPSAEATPGYPLDAASQTACALRSPGGAALFTLGQLLTEHPPLPDDFAAQTPDRVYAAFRARQCASAMLTTGQATAFSALVGGGGGFPFRVMTADEVITDQVWLGSITADAPDEAALLLSHLTSRDAQRTLAAQGLYTVRTDLTLYAADFPARVEQAARRGLSAVNAYLSPETVRNAAWQFFQGRSTLDEVLTPLL